MDFVLLKVNGRDLTSASHEETVEAFQNASEPILVEVRRKSEFAQMRRLTASKSTQTDENLRFDLSLLDATYSNAKPNVIKNEITLDNGIECLDDQLVNVEYEEVRLKRKSKEEKIGLTLCYGSTDEDVTDIYVGEIEKDSIAGRDGRIKEGDQILQINGVDVHSREEAVKLFGQSTADICLLLARGSNMEETILENSDFESLLQNNDLSVLLRQADDSTTDTATKDSGVGRTNDESSETEEKASPHRKPSIEREIEALNKEMAEIELECQEIVEAHTKSKLTANTNAPPVVRSPRLVPRMGTRLDYSQKSPPQMQLKENILRLKEDKEKDSENNNENPLPLPLSLPLPLPPPTLPHPPPPLPPRKKLPKSNSSNSVQSQTPLAAVNDHYSSILPFTDVMYTNEANLYHTIELQQTLFQQKLERHLPKKIEATTTTTTTTATITKEYSPIPTPPPPAPADQMEWVVKMRADGTRYIARRPVRNKILRERAKRLNLERSGLTTDDDAVSELKLGRFWSKEERKRQLEKAREHRRRKQEAAVHTRKETAEIVHMSHRKMLRHKGKKILDDFTTIQEVLAHGARTTDARTYNPLLSVTTV